MTASTWKLHKAERADMCEWAQMQLDDPLGIGGKVAAKFVGQKSIAGLEEAMSEYAESLLVALRPNALTLVRVQCTLSTDKRMAMLRAHGRTRR